MKISDLFIIKYWVNLELINLEECQKSDSSSINFVSRTEKNNWISAYVHRVDDIVPNPANTISVAWWGSVLSTFYQREEYYSWRDIYVLIPKNEMTEIELLFYCYCIRQNKYRYNYWRQANKTLKDIEIPKSIPQERQDLTIEKLNTINQESIIQELPFNINNWCFFKVNHLFDVYSAKVSSKSEIEEFWFGKYPFVTGQAINNGAEGLYDFFTEDGNVITIDRITFGFVGYQPRNFSANDNVKILKPKFTNNKYIGLFLTTIIKKEKQKYCYGRITSNERLEETMLLLPSKKGSPDFEYMENYIKSLPYSSSL